MAEKKLRVVAYGAFDKILGANSNDFKDGEK